MPIFKRVTLVSLSPPADLPLLNLRRPPRDRQLHIIHPLRARQKRAIAHPSRIGAISRREREHGNEEVGHALAFFFAEVVLFSQDVGEGPVAEAVDVAELAFAGEYFLGPFSRHAEGAGEVAEELDDLRDVIVIFAVFGAGLRVE